MDKRLKDLMLRQLDSKLKEYKALAKPPRTGWIRAVRNALGMSGAQLASRMAVTRQAIADLERREAEGSVTLSALTQAADALGCELVYALVPRDSLEGMLRAQAHARAKAMLSRVSHSMRLEDQAVNNEEHRRQIEDTAEELTRSWSRSLWDSADAD